MDNSTSNQWLSEIGFSSKQAEEEQHEMNNPQLLFQKLGTTASEEISTEIPNDMNVINDVSNAVNQYNEAMIAQNEKYENSLSSSNETIEPITQTVTSTINYPKTQYINKESFVRFVNALSILKNLKQNIIFDNGITHFVSDSKSYVCKFDIQCPELSFKIPFVEQQATQLTFLTRGDSVSVLENEDDYVFSDGQFKFQLRKTINDNDNWSNDIYERFYNDITSKPMIAQYEFTDQNHLNNFLSIIKGVKRGNLSFVTSSDGKELIISRGDINSGKFELLRIPCNIGATNNQMIDSVFDSVAILQDYLSLKFSYYYDEANDCINIVISGIINGGYTITFISTAYRNFINPLLSTQE